MFTEFFWGLIKRPCYLTVEVWRKLLFGVSFGNYSINNTGMQAQLIRHSGSFSGFSCRIMHSAQRFYFKIIYLHIIGMKTGWYICGDTGQFLYRNIQSIQKPLFQTWTKRINILVNKYISDMSLYWNVLLYIKYNTISFLFLLFSFFVHKVSKIYWHIP